MKHVKTEVPDDVHQRLSRYKRKRGRTWAGLLVDASQELPADGGEK